MNNGSMLTTFDNPFNPFTQYDDWYAWDVASGYNSLALLARIAVVSEDISEADLAVAMDAAIDEVVKENVSGMFRKITRDSETSFHYG